MLAIKETTFSCVRKGIMQIGLLQMEEVYRLNYNDYKRDEKENWKKWRNIANRMDAKWENRWESFLEKIKLKVVMV